MDKLTDLQKVSEETMRFMRGKYVCDEVGDGKNELKFRRGGKTILTIYIYDDRYDFLVIFGKAERAKFEECRGDFPQNIQNIYDNSKTYHDGKWMTIPVANLETLEAVKQMIIIKKKPNRKAFPNKSAIYSDCGHRCDLCLHYTGGTISEEFREELKERVERIYGAGLWGEDMMLCSGCEENAGNCEQKKCAVKKKVARCMECDEFHSCKPQVGLCGTIEAKSILAEDVTCAILPYIHEQYGN